MTTAYALVIDGTRRVIDNPDAHRFELWLDGEIAGVVLYRAGGDGVLVVSHVEVAPELRGGGVSEPFFDEVLELIRSRGLQVLPTCGWAAGHMQRTTRHHDLLADPR